MIDDLFVQYSGDKFSKICDIKMRRKFIFPRSYEMRVTCQLNEINL